MHTYTAVLPNPETLALERHTITVHPEMGLDHSINGEHRAHSDPEHMDSYMESLPGKDYFSEVGVVEVG